MTAAALCPWQPPDQLLQPAGPRLTAPTDNAEPHTPPFHLPSGVLHSVFALLGPRDLSRASAVCRLWHELNSDSTADAAWRGFYGELWPLTAAAGAGGVRWQAAYGSKMAQARSWRGRAKQDKLFGHSAAVRCLSLHVPNNRLYTGGMDRTVRAWDLESGVQLAASLPHGGTVRCLTSDSGLLASGSSDHHIRVWDLRGSGSKSGCELAGGALAGSASGKNLGASLGQRTVLEGGHSGPVTALELSQDAGVLFSGSWDYSVRVWDRQSLQCTAVVHLEDWVSSLALQPPQLAVGCGKEVLLYSLGAGGCVPALGAPLGHEDETVTTVRSSCCGRYIFLGTGQGSVVGCDLRCNPAASLQGQRLLLRDASGVTGLGWEWPCLAASFAHGQVALLDTAAAMGQQQPPLLKKAGPGMSRGDAMKRPWVRWVGAGVGAGAEAASCVALGEQWLAAGFDSTVATWDFRRALEAEREAAALRQRKLARRAARGEWGGGRRGKGAHAAQG